MIQMDVGKIHLHLHQEGKAIRGWFMLFNILLLEKCFTQPKMPIGGMIKTHYLA